MSKIRANINLESSTIGLLHYLLDVNEIDGLYSIIDTLVLAYAENYAEENEINMEEIMAEAHRLFIRSRRPQTGRSKEEQEASVKKSISRLIKPKHKVSLGEELTEDDFESMFQEDY